jgi:hypothetical protein
LVASEALDASVLALLSAAGASFLDADSALGVEAALVLLLVAIALPENSLLRSTNRAQLFIYSMKNFNGRAAGREPS